MVPARAHGRIHAGIRTCTLMLVMLVAGLAGCLGEPDETPPASEPDPLVAAFGLESRTLPATAVPPAGGWHLLSATAHPEGAFAAFQVPIPDDHAFEWDSSTWISLLHVVPLVPRDHSTKIDLWGLLHFAATADSSQGEPYQGILHRTTQILDPDDPAKVTGTEPATIDSDAAVFFHRPADHLTLVLVARGDAAVPFGALVRFPVGESEAEPPGPADAFLDSFDGTIHPIPRLSSGVGFVAESYRRGSDDEHSKTPGIEVGRAPFETAGVENGHSMRVASGLGAEAGWGYVSLWASPPAHVQVHWELTGTLHDQTLDMGGSYNDLLDLLPAGPEQHEPDVFVTGNGMGDSNVTWHVDAEGQVGSMWMRFDHVDFGMPVMELLGYEPAFP